MERENRSFRWSLPIGRVFGITVSVHVTFLLLLLWVGVGSYREHQQWREAAAGLGLLLAVFASVVLHELGHALTARRFGVATKDIILLPIGGVARLTRMPERPSQEMLIALAGPVVSLGLAAALGGLSLLVPRLTVVGELARINLLLGLFNLLPAFPMDGGRVLRAALAWRGGLARATRIAAAVGQAVALGLGVLGLFGNPVLLFIAVFIWFAAAAESSAADTRFLLEDLKVAAAMETEFRTLCPGDSLAFASQALLQGSQKDFPVVDRAGQLVGLLSRDRLLQALHTDGPSGTVGAAMESPAPPLDPAASLSSVVDRLGDLRAVSMLVVEAGVVRGMVTLENIAELLLLRRAVPAWQHRRSNQL